MNYARADVLKIKRKYEEKLLSFPNVLGVGVGNKIIGNVATDGLCLKIYVRKKLAKIKLQKAQLLPKKLDGIETDVEEVGKIGAL